MADGSTPATEMPAGCRILAVTGTDTEIGKTVITMALAVRARALGLRVAAMKPIESGMASRANSDLSDAERLARAAGADDDLDMVGPIVLDEPLAPMMAALRSGVTIDLTVLDRARNALATDRDLLLVEGAGGILAPITRDYSFANLFKRWDADVIVVAGNRLGVLNHTLLTVRVAESEGLTVRAVILTDISGSEPQYCGGHQLRCVGGTVAQVPDSPLSVDRPARRFIRPLGGRSRRWTRHTVVAAALTRSGTRYSVHHSFRLMPHTALSQVDWFRLADRSIAGELITRDEARAVLNAPDSALLEQLAACISRASGDVGQSCASALPPECAERFVPGGLRILFAVENFLRRNREVSDDGAGTHHGSGRSRSGAQGRHTVHGDQRPLAG